MSNIKVDYDILNQKQTPAFYASSLATRPAFGFPGRIFIDTDTPSSGIYRDTGSAWVQVADPGAGTTGTLQQVTTNGNTTTLGIEVQGININDGAGTGLGNTAIGSSNLSVNTTGQYNTAIGFNSLISNISGINNTAVGVSTLTANTTGKYNTAVGNGSLVSNTTAEYNTALGFTALTLNTTGNSNTAIGSLSLTANITGSNNVAVGINSLAANTFGLQNTAVGSGALSSNTTASGNTAVGYNSLTANTTGISNTAVGISSLAANTTGQSNSSFGILSLEKNTTGNFNTAIGATSLQLNTSGATNTAVGYQSLNANTTGASNTAIGVSALSGNTTATSNTAIGFSSLLNNTTGGSNTALGVESLKANTSANFNTGIGISSLTTNTSGQYNTALGTYSLYSNTTANNNTGIGANSLYANTTGANNTAIGYNAGVSITTGSNNTIIGAYGGTTTLTSNIVLSDGAGNVRLFANDTGKVGINVPITDTPTGQVDIHTSLTNALVLNGNTTNNAYLGLASAGVNKWRIGNTYNAGANSFDIYNIGTSSTALSFNSTSNAATFTGAYSNTSDVGIIVSASIPGINLRASASGRFTIATSYSNSNRTSFIVGTGTSNPSIEALQIEHSTGAALFSSSVTAQSLGIANGYYLVGRNAVNTAFRTLVTFDSANKILIGQDSDITAITLGVGSEAMRITAGGYTKISNNGAYLNVNGLYHEMDQSANDQNITIFTNSSSSPYGLNLNFSASSPNNTTNNFLYCADSTTLRAEIRSNGGIANYATNNVVLSDERLKKDITPLESVWNKVKNIEIVKYKYIDQTHDDFNMGVIAQQVEKFAPELVEIEGWGTLAEDGSTYKGIYETDINYYSIKAIQECMAKIEEQQKQIDAIKNN